MTETPATTRGSGRARGDKPSGNPVSRFLAGIALFVRQVLDELRKVVRPTWPELVRYTGVVFVFVLIVMAIVGLFDFAFHYVVKLILDSGQ